MIVDEALAIATGDADIDPRAAAPVLADEVIRLQRELDRADRYTAEQEAIMAKQREINERLRVALGETLDWLSEVDWNALPAGYKVADERDARVIAWRKEFGL